TYSITCSGGLDANLDFDYSPGTLKVNRIPADIQAGSGTKVYGTSDAALATTQTGVLAGDIAGITFATTRVAGEGVGDYVTTATATGGASGNYLFTPHDGNFSITQKAITVTATSLTKFLGFADPPLTYAITFGGPLVGTDSFAGALVRDAGELLGGYAIRQGTLTAGPNYFITFVDGTLAIIGTVPPIAVDDTASSAGAAPVSINVLTNDSDLDGGTLSVTAVTQPAGGAAEGVVTTSGNVVVFTPAPGFVGTVTFTYTIGDGQGGTATATVTVTITKPTCTTTDGYLTYSQGGWGGNGAPGQFLAAKFGQVYPSGYVIIGGNQTLKFTSANAVKVFLPAGGTAAVLTSSAVNPTSSSAGVFAGQLLAMRLAVDFSAAGATQAGLGDLVMLSGPFAGSTVNQILAVANAVIGGQTSALPSGMSISTLSGILESLNMNFHEGTTNNRLLGCPGQCVAGTIILNETSSGMAGNIRTFGGAGVSVKASAFSRVKSNGVWNTAYLGAFGAAGLGVIDGSEGDGSNDRHKVDNIGDRLNYVLFEFSKPVIVTRAFLDSLGSDSDATIWIGTKTDPFANHVTLSDALLASLGAPQTSAASGSTDRWATFNSGNTTGNVLVIAADVTDTTPEDAFKIAKLDLKCETVNRPPDAVNDSLSTTKSTAKTISVIANDSDPDGDSLTVTAVTQPSMGSVVQNSNGTVQYTPPSNWTGTTSFTYTISDGNGGTDTATVTVLVASPGCNDSDDDSDNDDDNDDSDDNDDDCDDDDHDDDDNDNHDDSDHDRDCDREHSRNSRCNDNDGWYRDHDRNRQHNHNHNRNGVCADSSHFRSWYR
ncbi:MAG: conserved repeat protein, partial [Acidimicrobiaceae bacterium]